MMEYVVSILLLSFLQVLWVTHCYRNHGSSFHQPIRWIHSTTIAPTNSQSNRVHLYADSQQCMYTRRRRQLYMQSKRSLQPPIRSTTTSSAPSSAYLLPTPPVNSIGNFFDQGTLVPSSTSANSDSDDDSSGGGMSFIQCHMIAVGEIEGEHYL